MDSRTYLSLELRRTRDRVAMLEQHRGELERVVAALLDLITPNRGTQSALLAAVEQSLQPPRTISDHRLRELLRGP